MEIRYAKYKDLNALVELCKAHAIYERSDYHEANKSELLAQHLFKAEDLKCLVVEVDNKLVGYATFMKQFSTWDVEFYIYLDCLYLNQTYRQKGVGKALMRLVRQYANENNCKTIQWQTPADNHSAIQFYERLGAFSKSKERFFWQIK